MPTFVLRLPAATADMPAGPPTKCRVDPYDLTGLRRRKVGTSHDGQSFLELCWKKDVDAASFGPVAANASLQALHLLTEQCPPPHVPAFLVATHDDGTPEDLTLALLAQRFALELP